MTNNLAQLGETVTESYDPANAMWHFMTTPVPDSTVAKETTGKIFTTTVNTATPTTNAPTTKTKHKRF